MQKYVPTGHVIVQHSSAGSLTPVDLREFGRIRHDLRRTKDDDRFGLQRVGSPTMGSSRRGEMLAAPTVAAKYRERSDSTACRWQPVRDLLFAGPFHVQRLSYVPRCIHDFCDPIPPAEILQ